MVATSVSVTARQERVNPFLPRGIQTFVGQGQVTGTVAGGTMSVNFNMNPGSRDNWQPYVAVYSIGVWATTADPGQGRLLFSSSYWEAESFEAQHILPDVVQEAGSGVYIANWFGPVYSGRIIKGQLGQFSVEFDEIDTSVVNVRVKGLVSPTPFVAFDFWRF